MGWKGEMGVGNWVGGLEFTVERKAIYISVMLVDFQRKLLLMIKDLIICE